MKTTKSSAAEQTLPQPVSLETSEEEEEARRAAASPQPHQQSLRGQPRTAALPHGYPRRSVPHVCFRQRQQEEV